MKLKVGFVFLICLFPITSHSQTVVSYNNCDIIQTMNWSCSYTRAFYAKDYDLLDFGISPNDDFLIENIDFAINYAEFGANYKINIYAIDQNFPSSFTIGSMPLIGSSGIQPLPFLGSNTIPAVNINTVFPTPIRIPAGTNKILVEIVKGAYYGSGLIHFAGTTVDNGLDWYYGNGCVPNGNTSILNTYQDTSNITGLYPGSDFNWFMKVNGSINNTATPFTLNYNTDCGLGKTFNLNNLTNIQSVVWNFDDPSSGINNTSNLPSPFHAFSSSGSYDVVATITQTNGNIYNFNSTIDVFEAPIANPISDLFACENLSAGFSNNFDTTGLVNSITGAQNNVVVSFFRQNGESLPTPLPSTISNTIINSETITARIAYSNDLCCYSETTFDLIAVTAPVINAIPDLTACESTLGNGFSIFDLSELESINQNNIPQLSYQYYDSNGSLIPSSTITNYNNIVPLSDFVTVRITDGVSGCYSEVRVDLLIEASPILPILNDLTACDDNDDGISSSFDVSQVEQILLNNRTGITITYFNENGNDITSSFSTPFTNTVPYNQRVTIVVTDDNTTCSAMTNLSLRTISQPQLNTLNNIFACDEGNGFSTFDLSQVSNEIRNGQGNLTIEYFDENDNQISASSLFNFQNTIQFRQTITALVSFTSNPLCSTTVNFDLITESLPQIDIPDNYLICGTEPFIDITVTNNFDRYVWTNIQTGAIISNNSSVRLIEDGDYSLEIFKSENGITCSNIYFTNLSRSQLPTIIDINVGSLGNNFIEIIATGEGDFEYSIDGIYYQNSNYFENLQGGTYEVHVRDINGCGNDSALTELIDYPKFFTPNGDGYNDYWQIKGIKSDILARIYIYDRYGKLLKQIASNGIGWDGTFNGKFSPSDTYWFAVNLSDGNSFKGYFALKR